MTKCKKVLAMLLTMAMLVSAISVSVVAKDEPAESITIWNTIAMLSKQRMVATFSTGRLDKSDTFDKATFNQLITAIENGKGPVEMNDLLKRWRDYPTLTTAGIRAVTRDLKQSGVSISNLTKFVNQFNIISTHSVDGNQFIKGVALVEVKSELMYNILASNTNFLSKLTVDEYAEMCNQFAQGNMKAFMAEYMQDWDKDEEFGGLTMDNLGDHEMKIKSIALGKYAGRYYILLPIFSEKVTSELSKMLSYINEKTSTTEMQEKIHNVSGKLRQKAFNIEKKIFNKLDNLIMRNRKLR